MSELLLGEGGGGNCCFLTENRNPLQDLYACNPMKDFSVLFMIKFMHERNET